jgi:hypothetical protein
MTRNVGEAVELVAGVPAGVGQVIEDGRQGHGGHGEGLLVPSGIDTNPYDVSVS